MVREGDDTVGELVALGRGRERSASSPSISPCEASGVPLESGGGDHQGEGSQTLACCRGKKRDEGIQGNLTPGWARFYFCLRVSSKSTLFFSLFAKICILFIVFLH